MTPMTETPTTAPSTTTPTATASRIRSWIERDPGLACVLLGMVLAVLLYAPTLGRGIINYDDTWLVRDSFLLQQPSWETLRKIWLDTSDATRFLLGAEYLPVRDVSVMLDFVVWGTWYGGHHLTNLVLYLLAIWVWFRALETFGVARWLAGFAMLLWALHPSHAESVAWLSERKGLLGILWAGVAVLGYARFRAGQRAGWLVVSLVAAALAVWSKAPSAFAVAAIAGLELALPERRHSWRRSLCGLVALAVVGAAAFLPVLMTSTALGVVSSVDHAPAGWLEMALGLHGFYLALASMTSRNAVSYPISTDGPSSVQLVIGVVGLVVVLALIAVPSRRSFRPPGAIRAAAWIWLLGWIPASRLVLPLKAVLVTDRYALIPSLGFALALAYLLSRIPRARSRNLLVGTIVLAASLRTFDAQSNWRSSETLWGRAVLSNPRDGEAWSYYAEALDSAGRPHEAFDVVRKGLTYSRAPRLLFRKALIALEYGERPQAIVTMREAAEAGEPRAMSNLVMLLLEDGHKDEALAWARRAVEVAPHYGRGHRNRGVAALAAGHPEEAYAAFLRAYELWPVDPMNRYNIAVALVELRRYDEARQQLMTCVDDPTVGEQARSLLHQLPR